MELSVIQETPCYDHCAGFLNSSQVFAFYPMVLYSLTSYRMHGVIVTSTSNRIRASVYFGRICQQERSDHIYPGRPR